MNPPRVGRRIDAVSLLIGLSAGNISRSGTNDSSLFTVSDGKVRRLISLLGSRPSSLCRVDIKGRLLVSILFKLSSAI
jgi:hypothetical protein